ncbi:MAG: hypothetical protein KF730_13465 [Sphingomonas sp.]|uniref:helix-turn-helix transcriptional regulator n=1 Tax=Sphingomonas sp. TaxID=28214 RepID=UPI0025FE3C07|nr:hypothetical protein [Sphingomonas sp.]MBX3565572.1 hypothetical protein [Sphingomonas sp.]
MERIRLLCHCGAGVEAIASSLTGAVRDLIGADSAALFWLDESGNPLGFFHDCAPAEVKDLFITRFEELFSGPGEVNMVTLAEIEGPAIGRMFDADFAARFWSGEVYRRLCTPLGHHFMLDMRIEWQGRGRVVFCAWNGPDRPFTLTDAAALEPVRTLISHAVATQRAEAGWRSSASDNAHLITDAGGTRLVAINPEAEAILMASHLLRQHVSMTHQPETAPGFAILLARAMTKGDPGPSAYVPVADGRIVARASRTRAVNSGLGALMYVALDLQTPIDVLMIDTVMQLPLTPLQREIALFGMRGGARGDCSALFGVSPEALKKHLRAIYDATNTARWSELAGRFADRSNA